VIQESDVHYGIEKPSKGSQRFILEYFSKDDHASGEMANNTCRTSDCCTIDSRHQCWIKVRSPSLFKGAQYVEGYCSICLLEIEVGDMMVQSTRKVCHHVFHHECALVWLSTGKKRCPVCRNFFVPGSRVDDQDVIQHNEDDLEAVSFDRRSQCCLQNNEILDDQLHVSRKSSLSMSSRGINQDLEQSSCDVNKAAIEHTGEIQITNERSLRGKGLCQIHPL
jgi:Ring finger domain